MGAWCWPYARRRDRGRCAHGERRQWVNDRLMAANSTSLASAHVRHMWRTWDEAKQLRNQPARHMPPHPTTGKTHERTSTADVGAAAVVVVAAVVAAAPGVAASGAQMAFLAACDCTCHPAGGRESRYARRGAAEYNPTCVAPRQRGKDAHMGIVDMAPGLQQAHVTHTGSFPPLQVCASYARRAARSRESAPLVSTANWDT